MFKHWWSKNWNTLPEHLCLSTVFVGLVLLNLSGFFLFCFVLFFVFVEGYNDRCLSFCSFYFGHCDCCLSFFELRIVIVVCPSSSYGLWLLSVLLRVADRDCCLSSFKLRIVIVVCPPSSCGLWMLSVLLRVTDCDCCQSFFEMRIVIVVCPTSSCGLWLLSVLLRVADCDCCLSFFELRIVIVVCPSSSCGLWLSSVLRVADCDYLLVSSRFSSDLHRRTKKFISKVHQILDRYKAWIVYLLPRVTSADFDYPVYALWFTYSQWLLIYFAFDFERTWLKLLQKWIVRTKLDIYVFVIKQALLPRTRDTVIKFIHMLYFLYFKFYISVSL
jgi:hypothetical protein